MKSSIFPFLLMLSVSSFTNELVQLNTDEIAHIGIKLVGIELQ